MARIATIDKKEDLAPEHQPIYDSIAQSRGVVGGPFLALLHSPELAERTAHLGSYVRFESSLDDKVIELAALASARELECKHEWAAHINHAQKAGIPLATIRAVHQRRDAEHFSFEDAQIISFVREMVRSHRVSETTFQALYGRLGERGMVELTATIGYYAMLACTLNVFDIMTATGGIQDLKDAMNVQAVPHVQIVQDVSEEPVKKRADHYKSVSIEKEKVMKLKDQVAVITGAGRNIGKAIAKLCAAEGAKIAVVEMHEGRGRAVVDEIEQAGHDAVLVLCDVAHSGNVQEMVQKVVDRFGGIDILVNNAALTDHADIFASTEEEFDKVIAVSLKGPYLVTKYVGAQMAKQGRDDSDFIYGHPLVVGGGVVATANFPKEQVR